MDSLKEEMAKFLNEEIAQMDDKAGYLRGFRVRQNASIAQLKIATMEKRLWSAKVTWYNRWFHEVVDVHLGLKRWDVLVGLMRHEAENG